MNQFRMNGIWLELHADQRGTDQWLAHGGNEGLGWFRQEREKYGIEFR